MHANGSHFQGGYYDVHGEHQGINDDIVPTRSPFLSRRIALVELLTGHGSRQMQPARLFVPLILLLHSISYILYLFAQYPSYFARFFFRRSHAPFGRRVAFDICAPRRLWAWVVIPARPFSGGSRSITSRIV